MTERVRPGGERGKLVTLPRPPDRLSFNPVSNTVFGSGYPYPLRSVTGSHMLERLVLRNSTPLTIATARKLFPPTNPTHLPDLLDPKGVSTPIPFRLREPDFISQAHYLSRIASMCFEAQLTPLLVYFQHLVNSTTFEVCAPELSDNEVKDLLVFSLMYYVMLDHSQMVIAITYDQPNLMRRSICFLPDIIVNTKHRPIEVFLEGPLVLVNSSIGYKPFTTHLDFIGPSITIGPKHTSQTDLHGIILYEDPNTSHKYPDYIASGRHPDGDHRTIVIEGREFHSYQHLDFDAKPHPPHWRFGCFLNYHPSNPDRIIPTYCFGTFKMFMGIAPAHWTMLDGLIYPTSLVTSGRVPLYITTALFHVITNPNFVGTRVDWGVTPHLPGLYKTSFWDSYVPITIKDGKYVVPQVVLHAVSKADRDWVSAISLIIALE